jgi:hypothetical protein
VLFVLELKGVKREVLQVKKGIAIAMLIVAVALAGCGHYYGRDRD